MSQPIECAGHPRDMGLAQGRALQARIRAEVVRRGLPPHRSRWPSLRPLVSGPLRGRGAGRELFRHFAHQAERLEGLAQAADLPLDSLLELQLRVRAGIDGTDWIVRESRPVVGFRSLEVTLPWLVPAVAGVNAAGLAVIARWPQEGAAPSRDPRDGAAPPLLLVQDCLARFEQLAGAIDWCCKRPVEGEQVIALADATGARAQVVVSGRTRRVEGPASPGPGEADRLVGVLGRAGRSQREDVVELDPARRLLWLEAPGENGMDEAREYALAPHAE